MGNNDPILWVNTANVLGRPYQGNLVENANGLVERRPQIGHVGDHDDHVPIGKRYRMMLRHDGVVAAICHGNGAAHVPQIINNLASPDTYAQNVIHKGRTLGWIPLDGTCLVDFVLQGVVLSPMLAIKELGERCAPGQPCRHIEAERVERERTSRPRAIHEAALRAESAEKDEAAAVQARVAANMTKAVVGELLDKLDQRDAPKRKKNGDE